MSQTKTSSELLRIAMVGRYNYETARASAILKILNQAPVSQRLDLLEFLVTNFRLLLENDDDISEVPGRPLNKKLFDDLAQWLRADVSDFIHNQMTQNPSPRIFSKNLWAWLGHYQGELQVAAFCLLMDSVLPYARLNKKRWSVAASEINQTVAFANITDKIALAHRLIMDPTIKTSITPALVTLLEKTPDRAEREVLLEQILVRWGVYAQKEITDQETMSDTLVYSKHSAS